MAAMSVNEEIVFRIMLAPDVHLGFADEDSTRYDDSFIVFEEILEKAVAECVDFVLFTGNLFHCFKPSTKTIQRTMTLIRQYCMGERKINLQFLSDPTPNSSINFAEPNSGISLPLFSIHGRNDGPFGKDPTCPLEVLSASGLLNFFGRLTDDFTFVQEADDEDYSFNIAVRDVPRPSELTAINIKPLVFQKGSTQLAIYGLGHQNDTKLHNRFRNNKVNFHDLDKERVNVCLLHQNRVARRREDFIPESLLPADLDLIVWGGEDECNFNLQQRVVQTGRAVTTSLTNVNSCLKHIGILEVKNKQFEVSHKRLETARPFMFRSIKLSDDPFKHEADIPLADRAQQFLTRVIESMILGSAAQRTGNDAQPTLPLIHIIVEYNEEDQLFNLTRFGQHFVGRVANPFSLVKINSTRNPGQGTNGPVNRRLHSMGELVQRYFQTQDNPSQMRILSVGGVNEAVMALVDRRDTDALEDCVDFQRLAAVTELQQRTSRIGLDYQVNRVRDSMAIEHHVEALREERGQDGREVLAMLLDSDQRQQIRRQKELESLQGVSISVTDIAEFTAQQRADRAIALGQQPAMAHQPIMVQQPAMVQQAHQPLMVQQPAMTHQPLMVHQPAMVRQAHQPLMVQQPALVQHPVIIQQAIMGQAVSQAMAQQPIMDQAIVQQSAAFLQNRTQQSVNQDYLLASTSNANVDTFAGYYRASGTPSSDTDSSTTSSTWVDRLDGVTQYRRSTTYQQPDQDTIAQYRQSTTHQQPDQDNVAQYQRPSPYGADEIATDLQHRGSTNVLLRDHDGQYLRPTGNSVQQPDDDVVYLGFSKEPRNQDQGPRRKRPKLETKTGDSSCQPHYNQHG